MKDEEIRTLCIAVMILLITAMVINIFLPLPEKPKEKKEKPSPPTDIVAYWPLDNSNNWDTIGPHFGKEESYEEYKNNSIRLCEYKYMRKVEDDGDLGERKINPKYPCEEK